MEDSPSIPSATPAEEPISLAQLFTQITKSYRELSESAGNESGVLSLIEQMKEFDAGIEKHAVFSKNEEIEDYQTNTIRWLAMPYYIGKMHACVTNLMSRRDHLLQSIDCFKAFMDNCIRLRIVSADETTGMMKDGTAEEQRNKKIAKYKREKEMREKIDGLRSRLEASPESDMEEELRELSTLELKLFCNELVGDLPMIHQVRW
jgi:hypothetical protein